MTRHINRPKFRYYPLSKGEKLILKKRITTEQLAQESFFKINSLAMTLKLPKQYWREGNYFFPINKKSVRKSLSDLCSYLAFVYHNSEWYCHNDVEDSLIDYPQPSSKEWYCLTHIPKEYLNKKGWAVINYWNRQLELKKMHYDIKLRFNQILKNL